MTHPRTAHLVLAFLLVVSCVVPAWGFAECSTRHSASDLEQAFREELVRAAPVRFHALAEEITLVTKERVRLIPFATIRDGSKIVVVPPAFAAVLCQVSLATFIWLESTSDEEMDAAAAAAAKCLGAVRGESTCLVAFGNDLERRFQSAFKGLTTDQQRTAYGLFEDALYEVVAHEYAHHFYNHFTRIRTADVSRIDAEFEADYFAIMDGAQNGKASSAMYYFFNSLAQIERYTSATSELYETGSCRANNVENVAKFIHAAPIVLLDATWGGQYRVARNSPEILDALNKELFGGIRPTLIPGSCGKLAPAILSQAYDELNELYQRVTRDSRLLFGATEQIPVQRWQALLNDLMAMTRRFKYMRGLAAKHITVFLERLRMSDADRSSLSTLMDGLLARREVVDNFESGEFGNLLQAKALAILQQRTDLSLDFRMDQAAELLVSAVDFNPAQSEAWMNLGLVAFKRGDCAAAARYGARSLATLTSDQDRPEASFFVSTMEKFAKDPEKCRAEGARFPLYPKPE